MLAQLVAPRQHHQSAKGRVCCPWCSPALAAHECDPAGTSLGQGLRQSSSESGPALRALEELTWGEQSRVSATTAPAGKDPMRAGSPLPGIPLSVPDCDQETLLLILLLHGAVTEGTAHQPPQEHPARAALTATASSQPGVLLRPCTEPCSPSPESNLLTPDSCKGM